MEPRDIMCPEVAKTQLREGGDTLVNVAKLKARMVEMSLTQAALSACIGIDRSTLNRKINNVEGDVLTVKEAGIIAKVLGIDSVDEYFFCDVVAETQPK